jgi:type I restriction-modification system DNA methylase subunit
MRSDLLNRAYKELDLHNGDLIKIEDTGTLLEQAFVDKAQWLNLCRYISRDKPFKAESIFFVKDSPVIVFVHSTETDESRLPEIYNRIWCMANPRILFISTPTELNVYDLAGKPAQKAEDLQPLETVKNAADIASVLKRFRRESVESGEVFGDARFEKTDTRADKALINDIKSVRTKLFEAGLDGDNLKYAHALIGRSIFIRYLEDREILTDDYFYRVAAEKSEWEEILNSRPSKPDLYPGISDLLYLKVLGNIEFTYRLYERLSLDFNGDMFPTDQNERKVVKAEHLLLLQRFLKGDTGGQGSLFFWAYKFDIIPIELISNIYEELYHFEDLKVDNQNIKKNKQSNYGTHYTPASLVEFVISRVLTVDKLQLKPRIIDPACGSGIFLVEAFRRIVRHELFKSKNKRLSFDRLENILRNQIRGIELNREAIRIAAFSLYLAFLHYQEPPDILHQIEAGNKLPHLIYTEEKKQGKKYFDILVRANAFAIEKAISDEEVRKDFLSDCADIVVGNPPWGNVSTDDKTGREILDSILKWCKDKKIEMPDKERSQAFIWRAIDLLRHGGSSALLVSSGVLLKSSDKSSRFKQNLLRSIRFQEVVNFVLVRNIFFSSAISPFISIVFKKETPPPDAYINYWTARKTKVIENTKSVILNKTDFKFFKYSDTYNDDIWKIYFLGNHIDNSLINGLLLYTPLRKLEVDNLKRRQGFKESVKDRKDSGWLKKFKELPTEAFESKYGAIDFEAKLRKIPSEVREKGIPALYEGMRILIRGGPSQKNLEEKGQIIARYETETFAFRHSINCIKLRSNNEDDYKVLLGVLWSSLARYYFFMTSSRWGVWHDDILLNELLEIPVIFPGDGKLKNRIIKIVDELRNYTPQMLGNNNEISIAERKLDEAIFELYSLTEAECDLIRDRCKYDISSFYNPSENTVEFTKAAYGMFRSLPANKNRQRGLEGYIYTFLKSWNPEVEEGKEFNWQIIHHPAAPMIAVIFRLQEKGEIISRDISPDEFSEWQKALSKLDRETRIPISRKIYIEGIVRVVAKNQIIIIKRNEERLWTRSAAYEDVEATFLQALEKEKRWNA